jgi:RHS repeat-associated protein
MLAMALLLCLCWTAPLLAQPPAGGATYRVTVVLYPGDDPAAVAKRLAAMYRGTLETPVDDNGSFMISLSEAGAGLMRRDPLVTAMDTPLLASPVAASAVSGTAALPASQRVETNATTGWTLGPYQYDGSGNIRKIGSDFYVHDKLGRLVVSADAQPSVVHKQTYTYDPYGNLWNVNTAGSAPVTLEMDGVSNRLASVSNGSASAPVGYDGAGNFVSYLGATYEYDALNVMRKSVTSTGVTRSYVYTANDERIGTIEQTGSAIRSDWTIRNSGGQVLRRYSKESDGQWKWQEDYIYRGSQMLAAEIPDSPKTRHFHLDHLGTPRLITGNGGAEISRHTYHPFGEEIAPSTNVRDKKQFTGHERDSESLDYMHARFYAPFMGRFMAVDPALDVKEALREPQLWNRYVYVTNNPLRYTDPDGRYRDGYFEKPMTPENLAMDESTPTIVKTSVYMTGGLTAVGAAGLLGAGSLVATAKDGLSAAGIWALASWDKVQRFADGVAGLFSPGPSASFQSSALQLAGELRYTKTAAQSLAKVGRDVPGQTIAAAILSGTRSADPQGSKGAIQITQDVYKYARRGAQWVQVKYQLRIIYNEADKLVMHANLKELK